MNIIIGIINSEKISRESITIVEKFYWSRVYTFAAIKNQYQLFFHRMLFPGALNDIPWCYLRLVSNIFKAIFSGQLRVIPESQENFISNLRQTIYCGLLGGFLGFIEGMIICLFYFLLIGWNSLFQSIQTHTFGNFVGYILWISSISGIFWGLILLNRYGLIYVFQHMGIKTVLASSKYIPWRTSDFFKTAVQFGLLVKENEGFIFQHKLIQNYILEHSQEILNS